MCTSVVTVHMCTVMVGLLSTGVTRHSVASETSSDYALPPDDDDLPRRTDSSDTSEPEHKLLKCTNAVSLKKVNVQIKFFLCLATTYKSMSVLLFTESHSKSALIASFRLILFMMSPSP